MGRIFPNAQTLAMRDPARAALVGAISGANFGGESQFGAEFGDEFGDEFSAEADPFGEDPFGEDFGVDFGDDGFGADFGAARRAVVRRPSAQAVATLLKQRQAAMARTQSRSRLIEPNKGSTVKVEKYAFTISQSITLGTALSAFTTLNGQPDTTIRPQRVTMNAPCPMFAFINEIKVANVSVTVGSGSEDAYNYNANGVGASLDMPTLSPANRATVLGSYSGLVPPGFVAATATTFSVTFRGPATIVA